MRHFMAQFGPALQWPWTKLTDVPELTDELLDRLVAQSDAQAAGRSIRELERARDDASSRSCRACAASSTGAGETLLAWERGLLGGRADAELRARVPADWVDYNGHVHESRYLQAFGDATDALLGTLGLDPAGRQLLHGRDAPLPPARAARRRRVPRDDAGASAPTRSGCTSPTRSSRRRPIRSRPPSRRSCTSTSRSGSRWRRSSERPVAASTRRAERAGRRMRPRPASAVRAAVGRDRRRVGRPGQVGLLVRARRRAGCAPPRGVTWSAGAAASCTGCRSCSRSRSCPSRRSSSSSAFPRRGLEQAVDESLAAGAKAIVAIAAAREWERTRERAIVARVRAAGAVLLGPNCLGVFDAAGELDLASNPLPSGPVGFVSQSGNIALETGLLLADVGLGFSRLASIGNQADLDVDRPAARPRGARGDEGDRRVLRGLP